MPGSVVPQPIRSFLLGAEGVPTGKPIAILADPIDPATGEYLSIARGFDPADAAVFVALTTVRRSGSAVENVGQRFADHKLIDGEIAPFLREEVRLALKSLIDRGAVTLDRVIVEPSGDTANIFVEYTNVARQKRQLVQLPPKTLLGMAA